jgi:hypothetical protein
MTYNESSYERTSVMRSAIEMVLRLTKDGDKRRDEVAKVVLSIADQGDCDAHTLAILAIEAMSEPSQKSA